MINHECFKCKQYAEEIVTVRIFDDHQSVEFSGHEKCANELWDKLQNVKDYQNKPVSKILKEVKFKLDN